MKKLLLILTAFFTLTVVHGQTNVSGGIFSNTSWTLGNSPYIVTDTVVVFPGVTLTIQAGVTVKFSNNKILEIRQAKLIAIGTVIDSIKFTSNSLSPTKGIWSQIWVNGGTLISRFDYCNFYYASMGINDCGNGTIIKHSNFINNLSGISSLNCGTSILIDSCYFKNNTFGINVVGEGNVSNCNVSNNQTGIHAQYYNNIDKCIINNNQTGIHGSSLNNITNCIVDSNSIVGIYFDEGFDSITNCKIRYNNVGIDAGSYPERSVFTKNDIESNSIGIKLATSTDTIYCNKICNNLTYDLQYQYSANVNVSHNYWCTPDSSSTQPLIYDAHNNISLGIVFFMPLDSTCYLSTGISENKTFNKLSIYPNPTSDQFFIDVNTTDKLNMDLYDVNGRHVFSASVNDKTNINVTTLNEGVYYLTIKTSDRVINNKLVIVR